MVDSFCHVGGLGETSLLPILPWMNDDFVGCTLNPYVWDILDFGFLASTNSAINNYDLHST